MMSNASGDQGGTPAALPEQEPGPRARLRAAYLRAADNPAALNMLADAHQAAVNGVGKWEQAYKDLMMMLTALVDQLGGQVTITDGHCVRRRALGWTRDAAHNGTTLRVLNDEN